MHALVLADHWKRAEGSVDNSSECILPAQQQFSMNWLRWDGVVDTTNAGREAGLSMCVCSETCVATYANGVAGACVNMTQGCYTV